MHNWKPYSTEYDPLKAGSIDGTDIEPHDKAISRAMEAHYEPPHGLRSKPQRTLFVARFGPSVTKHDLKEVFLYFYFYHSKLTAWKTFCLFLSLFFSSQREKWIETICDPVLVLKCVFCLENIVFHMYLIL